MFLDLGERFSKQKDDKAVNSLTKPKKNGILDAIETAKIKLLKHKDEYELITEADQLAEYVDIIINNGEGAIDTETSSLDPITTTLAGVCLYTPTRKACYIPANHVSHITGERLKNQLDNETIAKILSPTNKVRWVYHNAKFDIRVNRNQMGIYLPCFWDTQVAASLLNENESHRLKDLYLKYIDDVDDGESLTFDTLFHGIEFTKVPPSIGYLYAAGDAVKTYELYQFQRQYLKPDGKLDRVYKLFRETEMPMVDVLADMEDTGICIDLDKADELLKDYTERQRVAEEKLNAEVSKYTDKPINYKSSVQLSELFYDIIGVGVVDEDTPRGTGDKILEKMNHPVADALREYRKLTKLIDAFLSNARDLVNSKTGRVHPSYHQFGAATGRMSCSEPNLMQVPSHNKDIRKMYKATDGYVLISADYSKQEPISLASISGDKAFIDTFNKGLDIYAMIASKAYNKPYEDCLEFNPDGTTNPQGKERRSSAKTLLLGIMYGMGTAKVAESINKTKKEAKELVDGFYSAFKGVKAITEATHDKASRLGYVETAFGRKRRLPDMLLDDYEFEYTGSDSFDPITMQYKKGLSSRDEAFLRKRFAECKGNAQVAALKRECEAKNIRVKDNTGFKADAERQSFNSVIQGTAADITKRAMVLMHKDAQLKEWGFRMLVPIHDEILCECKEEFKKEVAERVGYLMCEAPKPIISEVTMKTDIEVTKVWYGESVL